MCPGQPRLELPVELHKEIIDILGDEVSMPTESKYEVDKEGLGTVCILSLVCKAWSSFAIQHIFRMVHLKTNWRERQTRDLNGGKGHVECFLALIQANPGIARYVQYVHLELPCSADSEEHVLVEKVCRIIKPIKSLKLNFNSFSPYFGGESSLLYHPHLFNAVISLIQCPEFREFVLVCQQFSTSFLQYTPNLECLNFTNSPIALLEDHFKSYRLPRPNKLVLQWSRPMDFVWQLKADPEIQAIFSEIEELDTTVGLGEPFWWGEVLDLGRLTLLTLVCFILNPDGALSDPQCDNLLI